MKKSQQLLSETGESLDYLRDEILTLGTYATELEELIEQYRTFTVNAILTTMNDMAKRAILLKETEDLLGAPGAPDEDASETSATTKAFRQAAEQRAVEQKDPDDTNPRPQT